MRFFSRFQLCPAFGILTFPDLPFNLTPCIKLLLKALAAELVDIEHSGVLHLAKDLCLASLGARGNTLLLPVESHKLNTQVGWLQTN
jgi:hypothetical protein